MAVTGSRDGLQNSNTFGNKVGPLVDVATLKNVYLTGINIKDPVTQQELPDSTYRTYIDNAVSMLEHFLDVSISKVTCYVEHRDYHWNDYTEWGFLQLNNIPVIQINSLKLVYLVDAVIDPLTGRETMEERTTLEIPRPWIRLTPHDGLIRLIPTSKYSASLQVGAEGFFPEIFKVQHVPHLWRIDYDFGFPDGQIPVLINNAVALIAAIQALAVGGNLIIGAGIAGTSISLDGLHQSIQTTQSAENSGYSATILDYSKKLFGARADDPFALLTVLRNYYQGSTMNII